MTDLGIGLRSPAGRPAMPWVQELDAGQAAVDVGFLQLPMLAAVGGVPDRAAIADGPAVLRIDERDVGELRVAAQPIDGIVCLRGIFKQPRRRSDEAEQQPNASVIGWSSLTRHGEASSVRRIRVEQESLQRNAEL